MTNNLLIYGSHARGDSHKDSDIDLLSLTENVSRKIIRGNINLSLYNVDKIHNMSKEGALFVYHLISEGAILNDENNVLKKNIFDVFSLKNNYSEEIFFSYVLLREIENKYKDLKTFTYDNSKIIWCLITVMAAVGAEKSIPIFSIESASKNFDKNITKLVTIKHSSKDHKKKIPEILNFIEQHITEFDENDFNEELLKYKTQIIHNLHFNSKSIDSFY